MTGAECAPKQQRGGGGHLTANVSRENIANGSMSHLKILRGNLARQIINGISSNQKQCKKQHIFSVHRNLKRYLSTKTATVLEHNVLSSPHGEITVGKETLTEHVFKDVDKWMDAPCVVSTLLFHLNNF